MYKPDKIGCFITNIRLWLLYFNYNKYNTLMSGDGNN